MRNLFRTRPFAYECPQCGNLHTGSGYNSETKQYCSAHARELAEEKNKNQRFQTECLQYRKQVEGLIAQLKAADNIKAQTAADWAAHYNTDYRSVELNSQMHAFGAVPYFF